jgi:hypothetical protein
MVLMLLEILLRRNNSDESTIYEVLNTLINITYASKEISYSLLEENIIKEIYAIGLTGIKPILNNMLWLFTNILCDCNYNEIYSVCDWINIFSKLDDILLSSEYPNYIKETALPCLHSFTKHMSSDQIKFVYMLFRVSSL